MVITSFFYGIGVPGGCFSRVFEDLRHRFGWLRLDREDDSITENVVSGQGR